MRHYELLPHVADVRLKIVGDSLKELFTAGVEGMSHLIKQVGCEAAQPGCSEMIEISAIDTTVLLIDFLAEVLTYSHMNRTVYRTVKFHELSKNALRATIGGCSVDRFDEDVKAVTYHEAEVVHNQDGLFEMMIVFDV